MIFFEILNWKASLPSHYSKLYSLRAKRLVAATCFEAVHTERLVADICRCHLSLKVSRPLNYKLTNRDGDCEKNDNGHHKILHFPLPVFQSLPCLTPVLCRSGRWFLWLFKVIAPYVFPNEPCSQRLTLTFKL